MQIPMKSIQVTVYEWALEFMYTTKFNKKTESFLFLKISNVNVHKIGLFTIKLVKRPKWSRNFVTKSIDHYKTNTNVQSIYCIICGSCYSLLNI